MEFDSEVNKEEIELEEREEDDKEELIENDGKENKKKKKKRKKKKGNVGEGDSPLMEIVVSDSDINLELRPESADETVNDQVRIDKLEDEIELPDIEAREGPSKELWDHFRENIGIVAYALVCLVVLALCVLVAQWKLEWKGWFSLVLTFVTLGFLLKNVAAPEFILIATLSILVAFTIITPAQSLSGFGNESILTIGVLFIVSKGIERTNVLEMVLSKLLGNSSNLSVALLRMMVSKNKKSNFDNFFKAKINSLQLPVALFSAFMNNAPVVAMMVRYLSKRKRGVVKICCKRFQWFKGGRERTKLSRANFSYLFLMHLF